jgi:hypothetical protein
LFGQLLAATGFKRWKGKLLLVVVLPDGSPGTLPAMATDILGEEPVEGLLTTLSVEGVRELHSLVDLLRASQRSPDRPKTHK